MESVTVADAVRPEIVAIFMDVFQHEGPLSSQTSPDDVYRWDSLHHIALVRAIEETFGLSLSMDEMVEIRSVGSIEAILARYGA